jgi:DNA invertase Pin-like site-specific DNA recombinase
VNHSQNEQQKKLHGTYARPRVLWCDGQQKRGTKPTPHKHAKEIAEDVRNGLTITSIAKKYDMSVSGMYNVIKNRI